MELLNKMQMYMVCKSLKQSDSKTLRIIRCLKHARHKLKTGAMISVSVKFKVIKHCRTQKANLY